MLAIMEGASLVFHAYRPMNFFKELFLPALYIVDPSIRVEHLIASLAACIICYTLLLIYCIFSAAHILICKCVFFDIIEV